MTTVNANAGTNEAAQIAIEKTSRDYIEGWYAGDDERMKRALHPDLAKRIMKRLPDGTRKLDHMGAELLVQRTQARSKVKDPSGFIPSVRVLDIFNGAASVRVDAREWIDYLHLAESSPGQWVIVNVLWELRQ